MGLVAVWADSVLHGISFGSYSEGFNPFYCLACDGVFGSDSRIFSSFFCDIFDSCLLIPLYLDTAC